MLGLGLLVAYVGFAVLNEPLRHLEELLVLTLTGAHGGRVSIIAGDTFQVLPANALAFRAQLTPFCSSVVPILALVVIGVFVLHGPWPRRLLALGAAATVVLAGNVLRIAASVWMGYRFGPGSLVLFHDWVGTIFALTYTVFGFLLMLFLILPSAEASISRAARVSDVL
jgi:exosortase/archaeosortase family protein